MKNRHCQIPKKSQNSLEYSYLKEQRKRNILTFILTIQSKMGNDNVVQSCMAAFATTTSSSHLSCHQITAGDTLYALSHQIGQQSISTIIALYVSFLSVIKARMLFTMAHIFPETVSNQAQVFLKYPCSIRYYFSNISNSRCVTH